MSPWTDLALTGDSIVARATHDPLLARESLEGARHFYLGPMDAKDPRVSPLYGELTSLPPVLLHVGEDEILLDDARRYADLLAKSASPAELHVWQGMVRVFPPTLPSCMPRERRSTSRPTSCGAISPAEPPTTPIR